MKDINQYLKESKSDILFKNVLKNAIENGYISASDENGKMHKYGISADNIFAIPLDDNISMEEFKHIIKELLDSGIKFKYQTNDEWKKCNYEDPLNN